MEKDVFFEKMKIFVYYSTQMIFSKKKYGLISYEKSKNDTFFYTFFQNVNFCHFFYKKFLLIFEKYGQIS